jgi:hypothetical protein
MMTSRLKVLECKKIKNVFWHIKTDKTKGLCGKLTFSIRLWKLLCFATALLKALSSSK